MLETHPFTPFIPHNVKYLLLGSFISQKAGINPEKDWYYGSKFTQFWTILESVYDLKLDTLKSRQKLFTELGLGIGDIIYQCERKDGNSLDSNLINIVYNSKIRDIIKDNNIQTIYFSSRYVEDRFRRNFKDLIETFPNMTLITLPSPSPRYALISKEEKIKRYRELFPKKI